MQHQKEKESWILPVEIGYYGRPVSKLSREQLLDAIMDLSKMYMELEKKYNEELKKKLREKI